MPTETRNLKRSHGQVDFDTSSHAQPQAGEDAPTRGQEQLPHERDESAIGTGNRMDETVPPSERQITDAGKNVEEGQLDTDRRGVPNDVRPARGAAK